MDKQSLAREIYRVSHLTGDFLLRSGQRSNEYFDKYMFASEPAVLDAITESMGELIPEGTEVVAGLEMGAIPLAAGVSVKTGMKAAYVRKKAKEYGTCKLAEGTDLNGKKVCVIEDVVTTGGQIILSVGELRKLGAEIDTVVCVIQRNPGASDILAKEGLKLVPLFTMDYIKAQVQ